MEKSIISKILIVGGGLTGSVIASLIKHEASANIEIWEKGNSVGGRFYTFQNPSITNCSVDMGAQYISANLELMRSQARFFDELLDQNKLVPLGQKIENFRKLSESKLNFVAPEGTLSLIHHFIQKSDAKICLEHEIVEINLTEDKKYWEVKTAIGVSKKFDAVILTLPIPEVLQIKGNFRDNTEELRMEMEQVKFSTRHAVGLMYNEPIKFFEDSPWSMKFFPDDDIICFISVDNLKRGKNNEIPSVLIHTTTKFSEKVAGNSSLSSENVQRMIIDHCKNLLPGLPDPAFVKCIRWNNSQVLDAYIDNPGCIVINKHPCLICGGDSFTESNFNGCVTSALSVVEELLKCVTIAKCNKSHAKKGTSSAPSGE